MGSPYAPYQHTLQALHHGEARLGVRTANVKAHAGGVIVADRAPRASFPTSSKRVCSQAPDARALTSAWLRKRRTRLVWS